MREYLQGGACDETMAERRSAEMKDENQAIEQRRIGLASLSKVDRVWMIELLLLFLVRTRSLGSPQRPTAELPASCLASKFVLLARLLRA